MQMENHYRHVRPECCRWNFGIYEQTIASSNHKAKDVVIRQHLRPSPRFSYFAGIHLPDGSTPEFEISITLWLPLFRLYETFTTLSPLWNIEFWGILNLCYQAIFGRHNNRINSYPLKNNLKSKNLLGSRSSAKHTFCKGSWNSLLAQLRAQAACFLQYQKPSSVTVMSFDGPP